MRRIERRSPVQVRSPGRIVRAAKRSRAGRAIAECEGGEAQGKGN
ncbi:hypothetical protein GBP346_B2958 [Burkholderia pseudomallei MSHR346]|uniref:Uncharacterized protein n=1 Tax=Burkholderia pseudomallei 1710a TaxID=320371 RepID=A0A0E1W0X6_BURPE|nr:hypothetical protein GBP346_B2958 [Burkholderia pseudomallei MSHR346]EET03307.1 hypothetical protein BURPS1710A_A2778 [Burkholderia pseudomallei 1710a]